MLCKRSSLSLHFSLSLLLHLVLILSPGLMLSRSERLQGRAQGAWQCGEFAETAHELSPATMLAPPSPPSPTPPVVGGQRQQMCFRLVALGYSAAPQPANNVHSSSQCRVKPKIKIFLVSQRRLNIPPFLISLSHSHPSSHVHLSRLIATDRRFS